MMPPEFVSTEPCDVQLIDTSEYKTTRGRKFSFSRWQPFEDPLTCFDDADWLRCLHGCMLCLARIGDRERAFRAVEDDGLVHELLHLAVGIGICTHNTYRDLRDQVALLQSDFASALSAAEVPAGEAGMQVARSIDHESVRALEIADQAMFIVLSSNCVPGDSQEHATVFGLINAAGSEVNKLSEADPQVLEAFDWLRLRGYVELATDGLGDHVIVVRRPGEQ